MRVHTAPKNGRWTNKPDMCSRYVDKQTDTYTDKRTDQQLEKQS